MEFWNRACAALDAPYMDSGQNLPFAFFFKLKSLGFVGHYSPLKI